MFSCVAEAHPTNRQDRKQITEPEATMSGLYPSPPDPLSPKSGARGGNALGLELADHFLGFRLDVGRFR